MTSKEKFKIYSAVYLFLEKNGKILLQRRFNTGYQDGNYSFIAGHLDGNETARHSLVREVKEEANIILSKDELEFLHLMHRKTPYREYLDIYFTVKKWEGEIKNMEPEKCDDLSWFSLDALPKNMISEVKFAIENIKNGIFYSEFFCNKKEKQLFTDLNKSRAEIFSGGGNILKSLKDLR